MERVERDEGRDTQGKMERMTMTSKEFEEVRITSSESRHSSPECSVPSLASSFSSLELWTNGGRVTGR